MELLDAPSKVGLPGAPEGMKKEGPDFEMLAWATGGAGARLGVIVHHDDAGREFAYDRKSHIGKLARGLDEVDARGWAVVSMKDDWNLVFAPVK